MDDPVKDQIQLLRQVRTALQQNNYPLAIESLEAVVDLARSRGDVGAQGRHLGNLALTYYRLGDAAKALVYFEQALDCARQDGDKFTEDGLLGNMGNILRELGRYEEATTYLNRALVIAQEIGDVRGRGIWLSNLGLVYDDLEQPEEAISLHQEAIRVARQLNDQPNIASRLGNLGNTQIALGDYKTALTHFKEAVAIYETLNKPGELALRLGIIGNIYAHLGRQLMPDPESRAYFQEALTYYQRTLEIAQMLEDRVSEAELLRSIGNVLVSAGQLVDATEYLAVSGQIFEALGLHKKAAHVEATLEKIISYQQDDET